VYGLVNVGKLNGLKIIGIKGQILGEVEGINLDTEKWLVTGLQVGLTNESALEAGFKRPALGQIVIVIPIEMISAVGDVITLKEAVKDLRDLVEKYKGWS
jgi:sporulation protein YlmC with PRC-barrel domain